MGARIGGAAAAGLAYFRVGDVAGYGVPVSKVGAVGSALRKNPANAQLRAAQV